MKYYRYLFLLVSLAYLGTYFLTPGLVFSSPENLDDFQPVTVLDEGFLNDNLSLLMVALAALLTFAVLSKWKFGRDGLILVTVLSFLLQFGSFAWLEQGSVYATALGVQNFWLLSGLVLQSLILVMIIGYMTFK